MMNNNKQQQRNKFSEDTLKYCEGSDMGKIICVVRETPSISFCPRIIFNGQKEILYLSPENQVVSL
jgi:hypothetical protein